MNIQPSRKKEYFIGYSDDTGSGRLSVWAYDAAEALSKVWQGRPGRVVTYCESRGIRYDDCAKLFNTPYKPLTSDKKDLEQGELL